LPVPKVRSQVIAKDGHGHGCRADAKKDHKYEPSDDILPIHGLNHAEY
jgi:hypothetical protein